MRYLILAVAFFVPAVVASSQGPAHARPGCTPGYGVVERPIEIEVGSWNLSFMLLAVGCEERLRVVWPVDSKTIARELSSEFQNEHPVQTLLHIRDRSLELRKRICGKLNSILGERAVYDVFIYDAKAAE